MQPVGHDDMLVSEVQSVQVELTFAHVGCSHAAIVYDEQATRQRLKNAQLEEDAPL